MTTSVSKTQSDDGYCTIKWYTTIMLLKLYQGQAHIDMIVWNGHPIWVIVCIDIIVCTTVEWTGCRLLSRISPPRRLCDTRHTSCVRRQKAAENESNPVLPGVYWNHKINPGFMQAIMCLPILYILCPRSVNFLRVLGYFLKIIFRVNLNIPWPVVAMLEAVTSCHLSSQNETIPFTTTVINY